jgi:hypothetical protein
MSDGFGETKARHSLLVPNKLTEVRELLWLMHYCFGTSMVMLLPERQDSIILWPVPKAEDLFGPYLQEVGVVS